MAVIPIECRGDNDSDSELQGALDCAIGNLFSCSGLVRVLDDFGELIPTSSANVNDCGDIEASFCPIATKCIKCIDEFDALARCIVDNTEEGVIDQPIIDLINQCPLTCTGNNPDDPVVVPTLPAAPMTPSTPVLAPVDGPQDLWGGDGTNPGNDGVGDGTNPDNSGGSVEDIFDAISENPEVVSSSVCGFVGSFLGDDNAGECENIVDTVVDTFFSFFQGSGW